MVVWVTLAAGYSHRVGAEKSEFGLQTKRLGYKRKVYPSQPRLTLGDSHPTPNRGGRAICRNECKRVVGQGAHRYLKP